MHRSGFRQPDLKEPNLLVGANEAGEPQVWVIDLARVSRSRSPVSLDKRLRDLGRLCASFSAPLALELGVTTEDWRAFAVHYLMRFHERPQRELDLESFLEKTSSWAKRKIGERAQLGIPVN